MAKEPQENNLQNLPACVAEFVKLIIKKMRYRREVRQDVQVELTAHFEDELRDCKSDKEKEGKAQQLIADFGDAKLLAVLLRRAKKRCRPLWRTVVARTFQTVGVLILCLIIYVAWFLTGRPVITTDYVAELNRIVRPVADDSLNAAPLYHKAAELVENLPDDMKELLGKKYGEVTPEQKQLIAKWLTDNHQSLELVIAGTQKPYYWQKYEEGKGVEGMMSILLPHLAEFRRLAYSLRWRIWLSTEQGRYQDAFDDIKSCYRLGQHLRGNKHLIEQLVGIAIEALAVQTIRDIMSEHHIDSATLATLQNDFEQMIADEDFVVSFEFEKFSMYDEIQRCFTEGIFGTSHLYIPRVISYELSWQEEPEHSMSMIWLMMIMSPQNWPDVFEVLFAHPNKRQTRQMADKFYAFWDKIADKTPAQIRAEGIDVEGSVNEFIENNILLNIMAPAMGRVIEINYRCKADVQATLSISAIERYRQDTGQYPSSLQRLVEAGYLKELPMDPYSDKSLVYKKTDDNFILYSLGLNFKDDGGAVARDKKGKIQKWADEGDWVFWPIQKNN